MTAIDYSKVVFPCMRPEQCGGKMHFQVISASGWKCERCGYHVDRGVVDSARLDGGDRVRYRSRRP